jgi:hypothetical protein
VEELLEEEIATPMIILVQAGIIYIRIQLAAQQT